MTRARFVFAATLVGLGLAAGTALAQTTQAPPLTPILGGRKLTPPVRGQADVEFTQPVTKRDKENVITRIQVKNISPGPIARLTIDETWYDKGGSIVAGGKGVVNGLMQAGEVKTITIETPFNAKMSANNWNFSHANGTVKPHKVAKMAAGDGKEPATKTAATTKAPAKKKK
jgi:hypothetical protein